MADPDDLNDQTLPTETDSQSRELQESLSKTNDCFDRALAALASAHSLLDTLIQNLQQNGRGLRRIDSGVSLN